MEITDAQRDMRAAFAGGAPGVLVSGLVWCAAGAVAAVGSFQTSVLVFFFGGMLIFPLSIAGSKLLGRTGAARSDNPFNRLALESTVLLFAGLFLAWTISRANPAGSIR